MTLMRRRFLQLAAGAAGLLITLRFAERRLLPITTGTHHRAAGAGWNCRHYCALNGSVVVWNGSANNSSSRTDLAPAGISALRLSFAPRRTAIRS